jgi:hypothetical protein
MELNGVQCTCVMVAYACDASMDKILIIRIITHPPSHTTWVSLANRGGVRVSVVFSRAARMQHMPWTTAIMLFEMMRGCAVALSSKSPQHPPSYI